jgi:hypothetical protein
VSLAKASPLPLGHQSYNQDSLPLTFHVKFDLPISTPRKTTGSFFYNQNVSASDLVTGEEFANLASLPTLNTAAFMIQTSVYTVARKLSAERLGKKK